MVPALSSWKSIKFNVIPSVWKDMNSRSNLHAAHEIWLKSTMYVLVRPFYFGRMVRVLMDVGPLSPLDQFRVGLFFNLGDQLLRRILLQDSKGTNSQRKLFNLLSTAYDYHRRNFWFFERSFRFPLSASFTAMRGSRGRTKKEHHINGRAGVLLDFALSPGGSDKFIISGIIVVYPLGFDGALPTYKDQLLVALNNFFNGTRNDAKSKHFQSQGFLRVIARSDRRKIHAFASSTQDASFHGC